MPTEYNTPADIIAHCDRMVCLIGDDVIIDNISSMPWYEARNTLASTWGAAAYLETDNMDDRIFTIGSDEVSVSSVDGSVTPAAGTWS